MSYLKFLNLVDAVRQLPSYPAMDSTEVRLLNSLAALWHDGKKISVLEAMNMLADVSTITTTSIPAAPAAVSSRSSSNTGSSLFIRMVFSPPPPARSP